MIQTLVAKKYVKIISISGYNKYIYLLQIKSSERGFVSWIWILNR